MCLRIRKNVQKIKQKIGKIKSYAKRNAKQNDGGMRSKYGGEMRRNYSVNIFEK